MKDPQKLIQRFRSRLHIIDGGLGSELAKRGLDISGKLWSAQVLLDAPHAIEQVHYDYLKAGAEIIITASYQLTFHGLADAGYSSEQITAALLHSVEVAVAARTRYLRESGASVAEDRQPLIAASIGPYGAYLADGSEYRGNYGLSVSELVHFHRPRFEILANSGADLLAFETIPEVNEVRAIFALLQSHPQQAAWIAVSRSEAAQAAFKTQENLALNNVVALGANCISPAATVEMIHHFHPGANAVPIIVYPNSGERWDAKHRLWAGDSGAGCFAAHARRWIEVGAGLIGGCCGTGPEHIAGLRAL